MSRSSNIAADPLSDVLSLLKPRSYMSGGIDVGGDWSFQFERSTCFCALRWSRATAGFRSKMSMSCTAGSGRLCGAAAWAGIPPRKRNRLGDWVPVFERLQYGILPSCRMFAEAFCDPALADLICIPTSPAGVQCLSARSYSRREIGAIPLQTYRALRSTAFAPICSPSWCDRFC
jgi:hypothetical protein